MEPPYKRRRLSKSSYPELDFHAQRAQNDFRLKSIFESIFDKYGRDFDGIGDEIDLKTGEIVVNNGHIMGMSNERDVGDAEYSSEALENTQDEENHYSIEYSEEKLAVLGSSNAGDATAMEESVASDQSDFGADSLMGDVPAESHLHQLYDKSRRAVKTPSDNELDELASSDIEWVSQSKDRLGARERWCLIKDKPALADEPAVEPAWRAPPLPNIALLKRKRVKAGLISADEMREYSDDERAGISLWTPEVNKGPRRGRGSNSLSQRSLSLARARENNADVLLFENSNSEPAVRRAIKWTQGEEELLIYLKTATDLTVAAMEPYFPERQVNSIKSHWNYMVTHGKASPNPHVPATKGRRISFSSLSPSIKSQAPGATHTRPHDHDVFARAKKSQTVGFSENGSLVRSSSKPIKHFRDYNTSPQYEVGGDHGTPNSYTVDRSILISDEGEAHVGYTMGESLSSAKEYEMKRSFTTEESLDDAGEPSARMSDHCRPRWKVHNRSEQRSIHRDQEATGRRKRSGPPQASPLRILDTTRHVDDVYKKNVSEHQANSKKSHVDMDQSYRMFKPLEIGDDVLMISASTLPDQGFEVVSENGGGARVSSPTTPVKSQPDLESAKCFSDDIISPKLQSRFTTAIEVSSSPKRLRTRPSASQQENSIHTTGDIVQRERSTAEGPQKIGSTKSVQTSSAQPPDQGKSSAYLEPFAEVPSEAFVNRQIVQVIIPLAPTSNVEKKRRDTKQSPLSHLDNRLPFATTETEDPALIREFSANAESAPAVLDPDSPHQENLAICAPTRSPSTAAAESQHAASDAFILHNVRPSLGPEVADSQPLSITPVVATLAPEIGGDASRPIILDAEESQPLRMTSGVATSDLKQPKKVTKTVVLDSDSQPLCVTPGVPAQKPIEEATESDIVESGSHPLSKLAAARSLLKKAKKENISHSFSSVCTAVDDYSEDELSYL